MTKGEKREHGTFERLCEEAEKRFAWTGVKEGLGGERELGKAIDLLELKVKPAQVHMLSAAAFIVSFALTVLVILASTLAGFTSSPLFLVFLVFPAVVYFYAEKYPVIALESKKAEVLGHLPAIASYLVISLRVNPTLEKAVEFAAEHTQGHPKKLLKKIILDIELGKTSSTVEALYRFVEDWGNIPEFKAFVQMLVAATLESTEAGKKMMLDKGITVLLCGLRERTDSASRGLETPILMVFTLLVILPLVFIGLVPVIPTLGLEVPPPMIFLLYDAVLPVILFVSISFIASSKPLTIPPIEIPRESQPEKTPLKRLLFYSGMLVSALLAAAGTANIASALAGKEMSYPLGATPLIIGLSLLAGIYLSWTSHTIKTLRDKVKTDEEEFTETLDQLSVLLSSGRPLPSAMSHLGELSAGKNTRIFSKAANNIRLFNIDLRGAFFDAKCGSAKKVYSDLIRGSIETLVAIANKDSQSIASVVIRLSEHIRNMRQVDLEMKKIIGGITTSMIIIAVFVGPVVGGVATSLGFLIARTLGGGVDAASFGVELETINPELLKFIIGVYVLETTAILSLFSDELVYGNDSVIKRHHLSMYLPTAAIVFSTATAAMQYVLEGMS